MNTLPAHGDLICIPNPVQDTLQARRRTKATVQQLEWLHVYLNAWGDIPHRNHLCYDGSTRGDCILKVMVDPLEACWRLPYEEKVLLYGKEAIKAVGGRVDFEEEACAAEGSAGEEDTAEATGPELVPFCWMSYSSTFFRNLLHICAVDGVVDFTPGDGNLALAAIEMGKHYVGFCHTEGHVSASYEHLSQKVLDLMKQEQSKLYNSSYASAASGKKKTGASAHSGMPDDPSKPPNAKGGKRKSGQKGSRTSHGRDGKANKDKKKGGEKKQGRKRKAKDGDDDAGQGGESSAPPSPTPSGSAGEGSEEEKGSGNDDME